MKYILFCSAFLLYISSLFASQLPTKTANAQPSFSSALSGFVENKGQILDQFRKPNPLVRFLLTARGGMNVQLKTNSFSYDTYSVKTSKKNIYQSPKQEISADTAQYDFHRVDITFPGANLHPQILAKDPLPQTLHCFNRKNEELNVLLYRRVIYQNIYPHIDLIFEVDPAGAATGFEYYFIVHPGGDPAQIKIQYAGAISVQEKGNAIEWQVKDKVIREHIPASYLMDHDINDLPSLSRKRTFNVKYRTIRENVFGFNIPAYNKKQTLVIDPTPDLAWDTYYGGSADEWASTITQDGQGNIFIGGSSGSTSGIATVGAYQTVMKGLNDAILGKFTADGKLVWMTYYGGSNGEAIRDLATDKDGNIFVTGNTGSADNISSPNAFLTSIPTTTGLSTVFIAKFDNDGHRVWGTYYGGEAQDLGSAIAIDHDNNIIVSGSTTSTTGIATSGAYQSTFAGVQNDDATADLFIVKFDQSGKRLWGTYYGSQGFERAYDIAIDKDNNILLGGEGNSSLKFATAGAYQTQLPPFGSPTTFIAKFTSTGNPLWCTFYGLSYSWLAGIICDDDNNVYAAGTTTSSKNIASPDAHQLVPGDPLNQDGFIVKFSSTGTRLWGTYYGGESTDAIYDIATDGKNYLWVIGTAASINNISTPGTYQPNGAPSGGAFIARFDLSGKRIWGTYYGSGGNWFTQGKSIVNDTDGNVYICGSTLSTQVLSACDAVQSVPGGGADIYIAKLGDRRDIKDASINIKAAIPGPVCAYTDVTFTAATLYAGNTPTYQWKVNGVNVGTNASTFTGNNFSSGDIVTCTVTPSSSCRSNTPVTSNSLVIELAQAIDPTVNITSDRNAACSGVQINFTATALDGGIEPKYTWFLNGIAMDSTGASYANDQLKDNDIIECRLTKHNACSIDSIAWSNAVTMAITESLVPSVTINVSGDKVCEGEQIRFDAVWENAGDIPSYQWQINGSPTNYHTIDLLTNTLHPNDVVECVLTVSPTGCFTTPAVVSNAITPVIYPIPDISVTGDSIITKGTSTQLSAAVTGNIVSYRWTPANTLSNATIANPVATPPSSITYEITAVSAEGCQATKKYDVTVIPGIIFPTAFSPNNDGKNDIFKAQYGTNISQVVFRVYNRLGQLVFEDKGTRQGWNGRLNGVDQPMGTFIWSFEYVTREGEKQVLKGTVLLVR